MDVTEDLDNNPPGINSYYIFRYQELLTYLDTVVSNYFNIDEFTLDNYKFEDDDDDEVAVKLHVVYIDDNDRGGYDFSHDIKNKHGRYHWGPLAEDSLRDFLKYVSSFSLKYELKHEFSAHLPIVGTCYKWTIW